MDDATIRASDADREHTVATMQQHVGTGRLTLDEFYERSAAAYRALTLGDLAALTRDLPAAVPEPADTSDRRALVPVLVGLAVLLVLAVLLTGALLAVAGPATADPMNEMMAQMWRMCG
jgi:hypothetical protein